MVKLMADSRLRVEIWLNALGCMMQVEFRILATYHDPLTRQANEGVRIKNAAKTGLILNSKSEFNHPPTNRVIVEKSRKSSKIPREYRTDQD